MIDAVGVAVAEGGAGFHGGEAAHATILLVELAPDLQHFTRRFRAAGKNASADDRVGQRERLDDVAGFGDAPIGEDGDPLFSRGARRDVKGGKLGNADSGHDPKIKRL